MNLVQKQIVALVALLAVAMVGSTAPSALAVEVVPTAPDWAWTFDDGAGLTASARFGNVAGTLDGGANTTWQTTPANLHFQYAGNGAVDFSGGISNDSQVLLDDAGGSDTINISGGGNHAFTVAMWAFNRDASGNANRANLFGNWFVGDGQNILLQTPDNAGNQLNANARSLGDVAVTLSGTVASQAWEHYVFVYDGATGGTGTAELFINGLSVASTATANELENWGADEGEYRIGGDSRGNNPSRGRDYMFDGLMDEVAVWRRALSGDEIAWLNQNSVNDIPEPATAILLGLGGLLLAGRRQRR